MGILIEQYGNKVNELSESEKNVFYDLDNLNSAIQKKTFFMIWIIFQK